jgi:hypothetical protein
VNLLSVVRQADRISQDAPPAAALALQGALAENKVVGCFVSYCC